MADGAPAFVGDMRPQHGHDDDLGGGNDGRLPPLQIHQQRLWAMTGPVGRPRMCTW